MDDDDDDNNNEWIDRTPLYTRTCTFPRGRPGGAAAVKHDDAPLEYLTRDGNDHVMPCHAISCHIMPYHDLCCCCCCCCNICMIPPTNPTQW